MCHVSITYRILMILFPFIFLNLWHSIYHSYNDDIDWRTGKPDRVRTKKERFKDIAERFLYTTFACLTALILFFPIMLIASKW